MPCDAGHAYAAAPTDGLNRLVFTCMPQKLVHALLQIWTVAVVPSGLKTQLAYLSFLSFLQIWTPLNPASREDENLEGFKAKEAPLGRIGQVCWDVILLRLSSHASWGGNQFMSFDLFLSLMKIGPLVGWR